jgi:redox-sensitive bicupin YhaK (pirin superfamily)
MPIKPIEVIVPPREPHFVGDGFRVHNFIPSAYRLDMQRMDPFIMLDYNSRFYFPPSEKPKGVGVHPHRGFETVTIAYKGRVAHHDSSGGGGTIGEGDVQWMTAASGVLHKEYHEESFSQEGGEFQMVQLWVNLPAKDKMSKPKYQAIANEQMGIVQLANNGGKVEVIAGEFQGIKGGASTFTPIHMYNARLNTLGEVPFNFPANYTTALLVVEGEIEVNEQSIVPVDHFVLFENEGEEIRLKATENSIVLVLSGEPIQEPIAAHGPFVMNTRQEIVEAFQDFQNGKFGFLED